MIKFCDFQQLLGKEKVLRIDGPCGPEVQRVQKVQKVQRVVVGAFGASLDKTAIVG